MASKIGLGHEMHPRPTLLSDFILGSQDGLVNVLGILLGLVAAGTSTKILLVAAFAALAAESISMGAVAYTSTLARRNLYLSEIERETREMREVPELEREEVEDMLRRIEAKPQAWLDIMMAFELNLAEVEAHQPRSSGLTVLAATIVGSFVPLLPFLLPIGREVAVFATIILTGTMLAGVGVYEARTTSAKWWVCASRMVLIGLAAGFAGFAAGAIIGRF